MSLPPRRRLKPHFRLDRDAELDAEGRPIRKRRQPASRSRVFIVAVLIAIIGTFGSTYYERWMTEYATVADPGNDAQVSRGRSVYYAHCAYCHGDRGEGLQGRGGADAPALTANSRAGRLDDGVWAGIIAQGAGPMPGFDNALSRAEILSVIAFARKTMRN